MKDILKLLIKWSLRIIVGFILVYTLFVFLRGKLTYSEGFVIGKPINFTKQGIIFKTYEGQLRVIDNQESYEELEIDNEIWEYSLDKQIRDEILRDLELAIENNQRAKLFYKEKYGRLIWEGESRFFVYDVEILED